MADILQYCVDNKMPFDTYWVDAGWYGAPHEDELYSNCGPNWWKYVGDWRVNTTTHPTGDLLPIADAVHKAGLKFLLWFEPERMTDSAPILQTHPEYRHGQLVDYGNPETLRWIQDTIYGVIAKHKIDVYRQDFNMDPGPVWRGMDAADRVGIAEAKHIAGMYKFLDDMRARFPDILQENCASGGRRIDIEMISRAHTYCRSDYYIGRKPGDTAFILGQNATLNLMPYLPFQGCEFNCVPVGDDYAAFSIISSGTVITPSDFDGGILRRKITDDETAWFKKVFDVAIRMRPFYMGDFYQLTDETGRRRRRLVRVAMRPAGLESGIRDCLPAGRCGGGIPDVQTRRNRSRRKVPNGILRRPDKDRGRLRIGEVGPSRLHRGRSNWFSTGNSKGFQISWSWVAFIV